MEIPVRRGELPFTRGQLDHLIRYGRLASAYRGVVTTPNDPDRIAPATLTQSTPCWLSHRTAARLWDLPLPPTEDETVHLTVPATACGRHRDGLRLHRSTLAQADTARTAAGLPVTSPARTVVDLARTFRLVDAVVAADAALNRRQCAMEDLACAVERLGRRRGVVAARRMLELAEPKSESPGETRLRLVLVTAGLPRPVANYEWLGGFGTVLARGDLVYEAERVWLEYDGYAVHTERETFRHDRERASDGWSRPAGRCSGSATATSAGRMRWSTRSGQSLPAAPPHCSQRPDPDPGC